MAVSSRFLSLLFFVFFFNIFFEVKAQKIIHLPSTQWHGFEKINFLFNDIPAYYIKPPNSLPGNPWVWRAHFPDWHIAMDSLLLRKGMYVVYINTNNKYGSPDAMQVWDQFYYYLTENLSFARKVALEGVSRGGLYIYGWAKRNPDKVSCIYAEAPVCDFKSWPLGLGKGKKVEATWQELLKAYNFSEKQALEYKDNPIENLEGLAAFKVPILHVISLQDKIVLPDENTFLLVQQYEKLGGPAAVFPMSHGEQSLEGHHFEIEHPEYWADFILKFSSPVIHPLLYADYFSVRMGLPGFFEKIKNNQPVTVAFLGGSITNMIGWRNKLCKYLEEKYPQIIFRFINAGIPSLGSLPHAFRLQRDVFDSGIIDLMLVEAAVNDHANGTDSLTQVRSLEGIVRHAKKTNPGMDIVFMSFADPDKIKHYEKQIIPLEISNHELIAAYYLLPSINLAKEVYDKIQAGEFSWEYEFKNLHPAPFGQELYFQTIKSLLEKCFNEADSLPLKNAKLNLPPPIDPYNFESGKYFSINEAHLGKGFQLIDHWNPADSILTREGFVHIPVLEALVPGAELSFSFKGKAIGMAVLSGPDAGIVEFSIDKRPYKKIDLYTQWSSNLHLPWYKLFLGDLTDTKHFLRLRLSNEKNAASKGITCRIVYFLLNE